MDLKNYFDAVYLINLRRRPDRLAAVKKEMAEKGWPFEEPTVFEAIDATIVPTPLGWREGGGAYGCRQSHCQLLEKALHAGHKTFLVLEDDICMRSTFLQDIERFLRDVPDDWQLLMLGGQNIQASRSVKPGVHRSVNTQRTHALGWKNGRMLRDVYSQWMSTNSAVHIDWQLGPMCGRYPVYQPDPFIFGQAQSQSDICGRLNPTKFWAPPTGQEWVVLLKVSQEVVAGLREYGLHTGYDRDPVSDIDRGLIEVFKARNVEARLKKWIVDLQWEVASEEGMVLGVWHPEATVEMVRRCWAGPVVEIAADTVEEALEKLPSASTRKRFANTHIILLRADKATAGMLRGLGWHTGNWRDPITDLDNGLREWSQKKDKAQLAEIAKVLLKEAENMRNGVACLWHPELTLEHVKEVTNLQVVEIEAASVEEAMKKWRASVE
jgi:hypothetical protein